MSFGSRASQHSFAQTPDVNIARSRFDRSYGVKDTWQFDVLTPFFVEEILPGDSINLDVAVFARLSTQIKPTMDNMGTDFHFFFVPNRLVWDNWEKFMGAQNNPGDSTDYLVPTLGAIPAVAVEGTAFDKFGIPINVDIPANRINALPFRAYNLIWNEWFRDQNLQTSIPVDTDDGPDAYGDYQRLLPRNKKHDYFTSAFTSPQKGPAVTIPLGATAPVVTNGLDISWNVGGTQRALFAQSNGTNNIANFNGGLVGAPTNAKFGTESGLVANTSALGGTIEQLRQAMMMQSLLELNMRGGTRYVELLRAHFKVVSPDFRLQRPEYLGGGQASINSHPVPQNSSSDSDTPQANLASFGTMSSQGSRIGFSKSFVEHGYVIGLATARGQVTYQQGLNRLWSRRTKWDFFWPKLQQLGEQAILNEEIYLQGTSADKQVWGYQERYAEYRYHPSEIRGKFRSTNAASLDVWHLAQEFGSLPALNSAFIQSSTPINRVLAVTTEPPLLVDMYFRLIHSRPMLTYSVPASLGRF